MSIISQENWKEEKPFFINGRKDAKLRSKRRPQGNSENGGDPQFWPQAEGKGPAVQARPELASRHVQATVRWVESPGQPWLPASPRSLGAQMGPSASGSREQKTKGDSRITWTLCLLHLSLSLPSHCLWRGSDVNPGLSSSIRSTASPHITAVSSTALRPGTCRAWPIPPLCQQQNVCWGFWECPGLLSLFPPRLLPRASQTVPDCQPLVWASFCFLKEQACPGHLLCTRHRSALRRISASGGTPFSIKTND